MATASRSLNKVMLIGKVGAEHETVTATQPVATIETDTTDDVNVAMDTGSAIAENATLGAIDIIVNELVMRGTTGERP